MIGVLLGRALSENIMGEELTGETHPVRVERDKHEVDVNDILGLGEMIQGDAQQAAQQQQSNDEFSF